MFMLFPRERQIAVQKAYRSDGFCREFYRFFIIITKST